MVSSDGELARTEPWERLGEMVRSGSSEQVRDFLGELTPGDAARAVSRLEAEDRACVLAVLEPEDAAHLVEEIPGEQAVDLVEGLSAEAAAAIVDELPSDERADLIGALDEAQAEGILARLDPAVAAEARRLGEYSEDCAGGLMGTELIVFGEEANVAEVVAELRRSADEYDDDAVQYAYVAARDGRLTGVLRLRDLLLARSHRRLVELMIPDPVTVSDEATLEELEDLFDRHAYLAVPVVDRAGCVLGVVQRAAVDEARGDRTDGQYLRSQGIVGGEEFRTMPLGSRVRRRVSWLGVNVLLNILAASVIAAYQDTLASVIALAVFLPIISDMSGCSGNQAVAVSVRELTLGLIKSHELAFVWIKEVSVGLINGCVLGLAVGLAAYAWKSNAYLGLVVGVALALNTVLSVTLGGVIPLILSRSGRDPALASGPILTTITDMCGFLLVLSLASAVLPHLQGV